MNVIFTTRHMEVSPAFKAYAEEKAAKLTKYYDRIKEIEVTVDLIEKSTKTLEVEVIVNGEKKNLFIAKHSGTDPNLCVDACVRTLERQLSDHHKMVKNRKHP